MARKKAPPAPLRPSRDRVQNAIARGDLLEAYAAARLLHANEPTPEHLNLLKSMISATAVFLESTGKFTEFNKLMAEADQVDPAEPNWILERASLLARGGRLADALMRVDESGRPRVLGYGVDRAIKVQSKEFLPDELHAGYDSIVAAFGFYEAEQDEAARAALEPIGLRSPFLEWKVFLRGLLAFAAADNARAAENFTRLDRNRIPYRLCNPYFAAADPAHKASLPAPIRGELEKRFAALNASGIGASLREIAKHLGREKPMGPMFRSAEPLVPRLKAEVPQLVGKLAACLYHAIIQQGQPEDLAKYRKLFGAPADDPSFFRLQARIAEEIGQAGISNLNWMKYDEWLAASPPGWSDPLRNRVRALIWHHLGVNADQGDLDIEELAPKFAEALFNKSAPVPELKKAKPTGPPPLVCFRKAVELAPDWEEPSCALFNELDDAEEFEEAERVGRALLAHHPDKPELLIALATLLGKQNRPAEALELLLRARAVNPLEVDANRRVAYGVLAQARSLLCGKKPADAEKCFEEHREVVAKFIPARRDAVLSIMAMKLGDRARGIGLLDSCLDAPHMRLASSFTLAVDAQLAKLKPADRKNADGAFGDALKTTPAPIEVYLLLFSYDVYLNEGLTYRGQKGQLKKFLALVPITLASNAPEGDFEVLGQHLLGRLEWKLAKKYATNCITRFTKNPYFRLLLAEAAIELGEDSYRITTPLKLARGLAEKSADPRHKELLPRIDELLKMNPDPFSFMDSFFREKH